MFQLAILIGLYSYSIFLLGILKLLNKEIVVIFSSLFFLSIFLFYKKDILRRLKDLPHVFKNLSGFDNFSMLLIVILVLLGIVNLIGALGPELSFDALWYHLTIPKIFLSKGLVFHIKGGLLYYSDMPKLVEMLYVGALSFRNEILAKIIHFSFGILMVLSLYFYARKNLKRETAFIIPLIFYSNLVVSWQSTTAYIDLGRSFFEILGLFSFLEFLKQKKSKYLYICAIMIGLAIASKSLAVISLFVFIFLLIYTKQSFSKIFKFIFISILVSLPWFIFSFINTGNPFYPFFTNLHVSFNFNIASNFFNLIHASDPVSPIYIILFPFLFILFKKLNSHERVIAIYSILSFVITFFTLQIGGSRFLMAYLPAYSLLSGILISKIKPDLSRKFVIALVIVISLVTLVYRGIANFKYIPVLAGTQSKTDFLSKNLNFSFGDFYDVDHYFQQNIKKDDLVLIYGIHNLYYVDFPFVEESMYNGEKFNFILIRDGKLPYKYSDWKKIYQNKLTKVELYKK